MDAPTTAPQPAAPQVDPNAALIGAIAGNNLNALRGTPAQQGVQPTPPPQATPEAPPVPATASPAQAPPATQVAGAPAAAVPAPETPLVEDPFVLAVSGGAPAQLQWTPEATTLFEQTYGEKDPLAYKQKVSEVFAKVQLLEKEVEAGRNIAASLKKIEDSNPALAAAVLEEFNGRNGLDYLSSIPNPKILGKPGKELNDETLFRTYMGDRFSKEEWDAHKSGDFTALGTDKETFEAKMKMLRPAAEFMHDQRNQEHTTKTQAQEQAIAQRRDKDTQALAAGISHASSDPFAKLHVNQETIEAYRNGSLFVGVFTQEDGTLHPNSMTSTIKAQRYDSDVKRAYAEGLKAGKQSGLQEGTTQLPNARPGGRVITMQQEQQGDPYLNTLAGMLKAT